MIDGLFKRHIDPLWESMATPLIRIGMTPNQVTATGLALVVLTSGLYLWHGNPLVFGVTLAFAFAFDALDGAVARRRDMCTKSGGYFDAMVDRYQELVVLAAIAAVADLWWLALLGLSLLAIMQQLLLRFWQRRRFDVPLTYWWLMGAGGLLLGAIGPVSVWRTLTGRGWTWKGRQLS